LTIGLNKFSLLDPENKEIGRKLAIATCFMFTLPIIFFYAAMWLFSNKKNPENWSGGVAIFVVNIIVGSYCYMAWREDMDTNDESGPRKGTSKQRVD